MIIVLTAPRSSGKKKKEQRGKVSPKITPYQYRLLTVIRYGLMQKELADYFNTNRHKISYQITKLIKLQLVIDPHPETNKYKVYKLTDLGSNCLVWYDETEKVHRVGIENARWKCEIRRPKFLQKFLFENFFKAHDMENWTQWNGSIDGYAIQVNYGVKTNLVITHPPHHDRDLLEGYIKVQQDIMTVLSTLNKKWSFDLSLPESIPSRQFTINDPFSKQLMDKTHGSQIKIDSQISFDQSLHTEPRSEFGSLQDAIDYASMPNLLKEILEENKKQNISLEKVIETNSIHSRALEKSLTNQDTMMKGLSAIIDKIQGKPESSSESKPPPLDWLSKNMFH